MMTLWEEFLIRNASRFDIDSSLPLRLQKRQLLGLLGFSNNKALVSCRASDKQRIENLFQEYSDKGFPFLILVSEKPSRTIVPPLFTVKGRNEIIWRDDKNVKSNISYAQFLDIISGYDPPTWLEFSNYIWGHNTIAGRLAYINAEQQIIELQLGVIPSQLLAPDRQGNFPVYDGSLSFFELSRSDYWQHIARLRSLGHDPLSFNVVRKIIEELGSRYFMGWQELVKIAPLPTLEFGVDTTDWKFTFIDIDCPSQWKEV